MANVDIEPTSRTAPISSLPRSPQLLKAQHGRGTCTEIMPPPPANPRKRTDRSPSNVGAKRPRVGVSVGTSRPGQARVKTDPDGKGRSGASKADPSSLRSEFIQIFTEPAHANGNGVSNGVLKSRFRDRYVNLAPVINELTRNGRLSMSKVGDELMYNLVSDEMAAKFVGLDVSARMVYQVIEKSGNMGIWTKDIRMRTNFQTQALNKIFKVRFDYPLTAYHWNKDIALLLSNGALEDSAH